MKKIVLMIASVMMCLATIAQNAHMEMRIMKNNTVLFSEVINEIDSIVFVETEEPETPSNKGALNGIFSVSETKQVQFSQGNLQYQASTGTWRFAEHQYDTIGGYNNYISDTYDGWIDLFGWGTGTNPTKTDNTGYSTFEDWGNNPISNGGNQAGMWRTLSYEEINYLFNTRSNAQSLRSHATVGGLAGYILLPDDFVLPNGLSWNSGVYDYANNIYDTAQWAQMESAGAVFLPITGIRASFGVGSPIGKNGQYWTSTESNEYYSYKLYFHPTDVTIYGGNRNYGLAVRLVKDK